MMHGIIFRDKVLPNFSFYAKPMNKVAIGRLFYTSLIVLWSYLIIFLYLHSHLIYNILLQTEIDDEIVDNPNCILNSVEDFVKYGSRNKYKNGIPKIIHYVYKDFNLPSQYAPHVKQCMRINDDARFVFWSDVNAASFVRKYFPGNYFIYKTYLNKSVSGLKISDINRYFILLKLGGIYIDLDTKCQRPFNLAMDSYSCVLSRENEIVSKILYNVEYLAMNSLMGCVPKHKFFQYVVRHIDRADETDILNQTGPVMLTNQLKYYSREIGNSKDKLESISLADSMMFSPFVEEYISEKCEGQLKGDWRKQGCKELPIFRKVHNDLVMHSITMHLFMHLGYDENKWSIKTKKFLCDSFKNIYILIS